MGNRGPIPKRIVNTKWSANLAYALGLLATDGCLDGDGYTFSYWDPRWKSSFMIYTGFVSGSKPFLLWLRKEIENRLNIKGHVTSAKKKNIYYQLKYAKYDSLKLLKKVYACKDGVYLKRKKLKIDRALATIGWSI